MSDPFDEDADVRSHLAVLGPAALATNVGSRPAAMLAYESTPRRDGRSGTRLCGSGVSVRQYRAIEAGTAVPG